MLKIFAVIFFPRFSCFVKWEFGKGVDPSLRQRPIRNHGFWKGCGSKATSQPSYISYVTQGFRYERKSMGSF